MKQVFRSQCAIAALVLIIGAFSYVVGQTRDPFVTQVTSSGAGGPGNAFGSFTGDISGDGRFVVIESNGDISTEKTAARNNADGNREIFLLDYAQRRIFQITNTKNALKPPASPTPTPTPSASPTPTVPTPADPATIAVEVSNNRPVLSNNGRWIVFSSNADTPGSFDGNANSAALAADGNQELFLYLVPATPAADLTSGDEAAFTDLAAGTFTRITDTPASRLPSAGAAGVRPFVADDNRDAMVNDNASVIAFVSTRDLAGGNADGNPEIFVYRRIPSVALTQVTNTSDVFANGRLAASIFNENPSLSGDGTVLAFISNANITNENNDSGQGFGNGEIYLATYDPATAASTVTRQVTKTKKDATAATVNILSPGRRLSRDGTMIAFETLAESPTGTTNKFFYAIFIYNITATAVGAADTFVQVLPRALVAPGDIIHFPTFTDYTGTTPGSLAFASALNFNADGTFPPAAQDSTTGLNPVPSGQVRPAQIFVTPLSTTFTFTRLTKNPITTFVAGIRPFPSNTRERVAFSLGGSELGGGNADNSTEVFYLLSLTGTNASEALSFFTGASNFPVAAATPAPSPAASPTPTPAANPIGSGLAPGELSIVRSTVALAPGPDHQAVGGSETARSPILPIELNGVSVAINGAAAGLYSVGDSAAEGIHFVMPVGLSTGVASVVVNNNGTIYRGFVQILEAQPDLFTTTNGFGSNRAVICNVTNSTILGCVPEPFTVTSLDSTGTSVATILEIHLTGVRRAVASEVTVRIGTTDITPATSVGPNTNMFGFDFIRVTLPASLAGAGDVPVIVTITKGGVTYSSRAADTAPHVRIN